MNDKEHEDFYYREIDTIRELESRNQISRDTTLVQLSVGLLAIFATFGKDILKINETLSNITIVFLGLTILLILIGFLTTERMFASIREKMKQNVNDGKKFYENYTDTTWQTVNTILNTAGFITFLLGIVFFLIILITYIGGLYE